ncbi:MAG: S-adenosylmethionine:tRNA ribosyltransferase-isomerase, partial [Xanthomonadales bacterium]|nr:S-adenosylmethionine:tRNA ribosyltransferase-isomerase [Xanthomonadales bacterium]
MRRADFNYDLPDRLIAQAPLPRRGDSRLLHLVRGTGVVHDRQFRDLPDLLQPGDLLVTNDTRVIPARLFATKPTGGRVEILLERVLGGDADRDRCLAQLRCSKPPRPGMTLAVDGADDAALTVEGRDGVFWTLSTPAGRLGELLDRHGHMPLPPYIDRADTAEDRDRYQTVYSRRPGAVAAPTAGLHFSE